MTRALRGPDFVHGACATSAEYRRLQADTLRANAARLPGRFGGVHPRESEVPTQAYVNHGRWLVDCPCGNAPATSPDWSIACCFECGLIHVAIVFPDAHEEIDATLGRRPVEKQNWLPHETVEDLIAQNVAHDIENERGGC